jgi:AcrR family transcriptional regulator
VRELCDAAEVSEATFFNYFKKKDDLLRYFIQIWTLEVQLVADQRAGSDGGLAYVEAVFAHTAERIAENPRVMLEIIGHMALHGDPEAWECEHVPLTFAERVQAFPELTDAAVTANECEVDAMFRAAVERAIEKKELPRKIDVDLAVGTLISLFFGTPLWGTRIRPMDVGAT